MFRPCILAIVRLYCKLNKQLYIVHWVYNYMFRPCILAIVRLYCKLNKQLYMVHWVYNYMFRPCILAIVRLYCKLKKQLYSMCVGYCGGTRSLVALVGGMVLDHYGAVLI